MTVVDARFMIRRDTAANWTTNNPVLLLGEPGYETNTRTIKYGDGTTAWTSLPYAALGVTSIATGTGLSGGPITSTGTISLANTAVVAGAYTNANITVDAQGRIILAANGSSGAGTVTSISGSGGTTGLTLTGGPITSSGTLTVGGTLAVAHGGTGITSFGTGVATFLGTPTSANLAAALTDEVYGAGKVVMGTAKTAWTPRLAIGGSSTGITYTAQDGYYSRVGDVVTVSLRIILSSKGAGSGSVTIEDLPFTVGANGCAPALITGYSNAPMPTCLPNNATTQIILYAATGSNLAATDINNSTSFYVTATYIV